MGGWEGGGGKEGEDGREGGIVGGREELWEGVRVEMREEW